MHRNSSIPSVVCALLTFPVLAGAQTIRPPVQNDAAAVDEDIARADEQSPAHDPSHVASALGGALPLWRRGALALRPHAAYSFVHGTGVQVGPGSAIDTDTQTLSPGLSVNVGEHWSGDYTPSWTWYSNDRLKDSFDESASLVGSYAYDDWRVGADLAYSSFHPILVETASQTHESRYTVGASVHYALTDRTDIDASASQTYRQSTPVFDAAANPLSNTRDWSARGDIAWRATDRTRVAPGVSFGYAEPSIGPGMSYVRPELLVKWAPTDRLIVTGQAGAEQRRFRRSSAGTLKSPVYSGSLRYRPFDATSLTLSATQGVAASYLGNAVTRSRSYSAVLQQRFFALLFATLEASRQKSSFVQTAFQLPVVREDRYTTYTLRLSLPFLHRGVISGFYERAHNASTFDELSFTSRQIGIEVRYSF